MIEHYISREKRDERARELRARGMKVHRGSCGLTLLHPQYVEDYEGPEKYDTEFGNSAYKTRFEKLYSVVVL